MNLRSAGFFLLAFSFLSFAIAAWLDRLPIPALSRPQDPDLPFYMRQPPWWAIVSAALGVACLHGALYSRFSMLVMLALLAGVWLGLVARLLLAKAVAEGQEVVRAPWWRGDVGTAVAGAACVAAAVALMAKTGAHEAASFVAVVLAICGLVAVGRWMGAVAAMVLAVER